MAFNIPGLQPDSALDAFNSKASMDPIKTPNLDRFNAEKAGESTDLTKYQARQRAIDAARTERLLREVKPTALKPVTDDPVPKQMRGRDHQMREIRVWPLGELGGDPKVADAGVATAVASSAPLTIADATAAGVAKVSMLWGEIAGFKADSSMDPSNSPLFTVTLTVTGVRIIYAEITGAYDSATSIWTPSACTVLEGASLPAGTSTLARVKIGEAERESDGAGGFRVKAGSIGQSISGNQGFVRNYYTASAYTEHTWSLTQA